MNLIYSEVRESLVDKLDLKATLGSLLLFQISILLDFLNVTMFLPIKFSHKGDTP